MVPWAEEMKPMRSWWLAAGGLLGIAWMTWSGVRAAEPTAAQRGERALLERHFVPPTISLRAYRNVWRQWGDGATEPPANFDEQFRQRYGLHLAPYPNGKYPMGLREANGLLGKALAVDCMFCHGGSIAGQSYVGLGNASLDYQSMYEDLAAASGSPRQPPIAFSHVRGTTEAGNFAVFLLSYREPDLALRLSALDLGMREHLCEDVPAWWLYKKKKTIYHTGSTDARSARALMQFMMHPLNLADAIKREEATFRDIQAYMRTIQPPKYAFAIDRELAQKGEQLFAKHCASCHGTYGADWTYPNKIVPIDVIGTDRTRFDGFTEKSARYYNKSWFAQEQHGWLADEYRACATAGYQAPPLDGIWATAPYFHNGSVPTVYHVLNSKVRPRIFTRSFRTDKEDYDPVKVGWKVQVLERGPDAALPARERRKVYDTTQPGRGNGGHTFGDKLTEEERSAVIEYLKTL
jgi:mono/diheme cytochrome c family protein